MWLKLKTAYVYACIYNLAPKKMNKIDVYQLLKSKFNFF